MTASRPTWRLIIDPPQDGFRNMALDEALLESCRKDASDPAGYPVLRLYGWKTPTLSLGRFQDALLSVDQGFCREHGIPIVRRPTGGAAVLHDQEVTYSLVGPAGRLPFEGTVLNSYHRIAEGIVRGLSLLGVAPDPPVPRRQKIRATEQPHCFSRASSYEITFGGYKLVGSAQVRRRGASLQHGSILLDANPKLFDEATGGQSGDRKGWTTLRERMGRTPEYELVAVSMARGLGEVFDVQWRHETVTAEEGQKADQLLARKYLNAHWTAGGRSALSRA